MKRIIILLIVSLLFFNVNAQNDHNSKWNLEIHHPLSIGDNFVKTAYNGVVGIDVRYKVLSIKLIDFKVGIIADYFNYNFIEAFKGSAFIIKPRVLGEFKINSNLKPYVFVGYGIMTTKVKSDFGPFVDPNDPFITDDEFTDNGYGFNFGLGLKYDISKKFFVKSAIDFFSLEPQDDVPNVSYNKNIQTLYFGVGLNL